MNFRMGLAKLWLPRGQNYDRIRAYICRMGAAIDMVGYHYAQCRVLALGNFTTTADANRMGETMTSRTIAKGSSSPKSISIRKVTGSRTTA